MRPSASRLPPSLAVAPGAEVTADLTVRNVSDVVDEFTFEVVGMAAPWTDVTPASIHLYPGDEANAQVRFRPPRHHATPAGSVPVTLEVISLEDPQTRLSLQSTLEVDGFVSLSASVVPVTSSGSQSGQHSVTVRNEGNLSANVVLSATDAEHVLEFSAQPALLTIAPGESATSQLAARGREPFRDTRPRPFRVVVADERAPPVTLEAAMVPQPTGRGCLSRVPSLLLIVIAVIVGLVGLAAFGQNPALGLLVLAVAVAVFLLSRRR